MVETSGLSQQRSHHAAAQHGGGDLLPFDPRRVVSAFLRHWKVFLAVALAVVALTTYMSSRATRVYSAMASLEVQPAVQQIIKDQDVSEALPPDSSVVDTEVEVLNSPSIAAYVADKLNLYADPEFDSAILVRDPHNKKIMRLPAVLPTPATISPLIKERVVSTLQSAVRVQRAGLTYVITIVASSTDPAKAARIANSYGQAFIDTQLSTKFDATRTANQWLTERLTKLQNDLQAADAQVQQYKVAHGLLSAEGATLAEQEVSTLSQEIAQARADVAEKKAAESTAVAQLSTGGGGSDVTAVEESDVIRNLRAQEADANRNLAELSTRYGPMHPDVQKANNRLRAVQHNIEIETQSIRSNLRAQVAVAEQRLASLTQSQGGAKGSLASNTQAQVELNELQRKADANRAIYEAFLNRSKETAAEQGIQQPTARLFSPATVPTTPSSPKIKLAIVFGAVFGAMCGVIAVAMLEILDSAIRTGTDVTEKLGLPYAGGLPTPASTGRLKGKERKMEPQDYLIARPLSSFAESFRNLRAFLLLSSDSSAAPKVIAVTSSLPAEGKSVTSFCLMRTMALAGAKTVLIDCDLRRRGATQFTGRTEVGIVEVLEGKASLKDALVHDEASGGWVLPASSAPVGQKDLFSTREMAQLLAQLTQSFDHVILDTPPTLAVADARVLSARADAVLFVVQWSRTPSQAVENALTALHNAGARIAGVALTQVNLREQRRSGYGDSAYYYGAVRNYYVN
ncbi:polysaccharide biosynthesis tyrosine autokinase [Caulobacter sp. S45]|uniref:GumC family protein n=1 Tax=Caulobacter sp. S45 TaxID=1641861 RepID=UPI00131AE4B6|nr:polysaccharide biosynthesis tyrosine autokinase [Caulobacter sp. S45]